MHPGFTYVGRAITPVVTFVTIRGKYSLIRCLCNDPGYKQTNTKNAKSYKAIVYPPSEHPS